MQSSFWKADWFLGVAVIAIDKQSIDNTDRWPWPRDMHARMIDLLVQAKARATGHLVFFAEPAIAGGGIDREL